MLRVEGRVSSALSGLESGGEDRMEEEETGWRKKCGNIGNIRTYHDDS